jgi:hypothetical protein
MSTNLQNLKTSADLLQRIRTAAPRKPSAQDALEQRVSFVYGSMAKNSGVTREQVRKVILSQVGSVAKD